MSALKTLYIYRKILFSITILGVKSRTSGNILGAAWLIIYPILFLGLYYIVFLRILNVKINGMSNPEYIILIFSGLVPFLSFSEAFSVGTVSVIANRGLLKNTVFPIEIIVAKDVLVSHVCMGIGMLIVWIAVILVNGWKYTQLLVPFVFFTQILLSIGVVWITSRLDNDIKFPEADYKKLLKKSFNGIFCTGRRWWLFI
jgi:lipopolysaccharide transport system permease protein